MSEKVMCVPTYGKITKMQKLAAILRTAGHEIMHASPDWGQYYSAWVVSTSRQYEDGKPSIVLGHDVGALIACGAIYLAHRRSGTPDVWPPRLILASIAPYAQEFIPDLQPLRRKNVRTKAWLREELGGLSLVEIVRDVSHEIGLRPAVLVGQNELSAPEGAALNNSSLIAAALLGVQRKVILNAGDDISQAPYADAIINAIG